MSLKEAAKGIAVTLSATGPMAMISVWFLSMAAVTIWGGPQAALGLNAIQFGGMMVIAMLVGSGALAARNLSDS